MSTGLFSEASNSAFYIYGLFVIAFLYFAFAIGTVVLLFIRPRLRRRSS